MTRVYGTGAGPAGGGALHIRGAARRTFDRPPAVAGRPDHHARLREYVTDLARPYGFPVCQDALAAGGGHSYGEMAAPLIEELVPPDAPVDLLVLAYAVPDARPGRATATYLSHLCPGAPLAFAVCDQGAAAGFTGLRLIREYARSGDCRRALLLVLEQAVLPYDPGEPVELPAAHRAVGLLCDRYGPARVESVHQHAGVADGQVAGLLAAELAGCTEAPAAAVGGGVTLIADQAAAAAVPAAGVRPAPAGQPVTGVWWELVDAVTQPGRMVLASHDRRLRHLCMSTLSPTGKA